MHRDRKFTTRCYYFTATDYYFMAAVIITFWLPATPALPGTMHRGRKKVAIK